jgi:hypothetical protein
MDVVIVGDSRDEKAGEQRPGDRNRDAGDEPRPAG